MEADIGYHMFTVLQAVSDYNIHKLIKMKQYPQDIQHCITQLNSLPILQFITFYIIFTYSCLEKFFFFFYLKKHLEKHNLRVFKNKKAICLFVLGH